MIMTAHLRGFTLPTDADVDVEIKIHTRLNISAYVAKQRANVCLMLYCGQSFCVDEPILQIGERVTWLVPVWLASPREGRQTKIGEFIVDAQTGEVLESRERCQVLKQLAHALLEPSPSTPPASPLA
jgi:hypothetical protein